MLFEWSDLLIVLMLVGLEGILSGDNALVLAVLVLRLPEHQQRKALRYGIIGAYVLRTVATLLAVYLAQVKWVQLLGGAYLLYLPYKHFTHHPEETHGPDGVAKIPFAQRWFGISAFWATVISVEMTDLVFAVDSILVAVAMTKKTWVIIAGGVLGITMMRLLTLQVLALVKRYPKLIDGAYIVVAWVGVKLVWEFCHSLHWVPAMPKVLGIGMVVALFVGSFIYARMHEQKDPDLANSVSGAEALFGAEEVKVDEPSEVRESPAAQAGRTHVL